MADDPSNSDELILRDRLALDRTRLANERTLLAYSRTALMLIVAGATAEQFMIGTTIVIVTSWVLIVLGGLVAIWGTWRFLLMRRDINDWRRRAPRL